MYHSQSDSLFKMCCGTCYSIQAGDGIKTRLKAKNLKNQFASGLF